MSESLLNRLSERLPNTYGSVSGCHDADVILTVGESDIGQFFKAVREMGLTRVETGRHEGAMYAWVRE